MATCSTSSVNYKSFKYDVFLSFRGEDTRTNFVDHLYHALQNKSIHTYKDDEKIKKGKNISDELLGSIEDSKFYIIVFSKNYASSSWCLEELVKIMECHRTTGHTAYPVFYDVEPSDVRKQSGAVAAAFAKHEKEESAGIWREALKEAANLAGWELKKTVDGHEAKFIQKIVEQLSLELRSINFNINNKLVGMESRIKEVVSSLGTGLDDVRIIGIKGMGGGGKTTLARAIFDQTSFQFEGKSFVENVREVTNASLSSLKLLQKQVLSDVLNDNDINISSVYDGKHMMKRMMPNKKVLVVLDDVDHVDQLEALAGEPNWFKTGSRIIITTRDEQVLVAHQVKFIHDVTLLSDGESLCLFSRYAFGKEIPILGYEGLSKQVVRYAAGLPLTIKVLGSFLCGKNELEWVDALERLKEIPLAETLKKLELSYIGLEEDYKEIFLDIACLLKGWRKCMAIKMLESRGFHARNGLRVLEQKSLIKTNGYSYYEYVDMHDHIQELGRNIVRRSHPDKPHKHSRLWVDNEIEEILANDLGTKATRCIQFYNQNLNPHIVIKGLTKMKELRFLSLDFGRYTPLDFNNIVIPNFPSALRYLNLYHYPFRYLPETFQANNLVKIEMVDYRNIQLWEGGENKVLNKLKFLNISNSRLGTLDLRLAPNLETLNLAKCHELVELHMSTGCLNLISINITYSRLRTLDFRSAPNLETLNLAVSHDLVELHMPIGCLKLISVDITYSRLRIIDFRLAPNLENLNLRSSYYLEELHMADEYQKLTNLSISHSKLRTLNIGLTPNLENLGVQQCSNLVELHTPSGCLKKLAYLEVSGCLGFSSFIFRLKDKTGCSVDESFEVGPLADLHLISKSAKSCPLHPENTLPKFELRCSYEEERPSFTRNLQRLISLGMCACIVPARFSDSICGLQRLRKLRLEGNIIKLLTGLDQLEYLKELKFSSTTIKHLPDSFCMLKHLKSLELERCSFLKNLPEDFGRLESLEKLDMSDTKIEHLPHSILMLKHLKFLELNRCVWLEKLPEDLGRLEYLEKLALSYTKIKHLPDNICVLKHLKSLKLRFCCFFEKLPEDLGRLECLEDLALSSTMIRHLPDSICKLKRLKHLKLISCSLLEKLPEDLGHLECLEKLSLKKCEFLQDVPNSIGKMKCLLYFHLTHCIRVEKLPEDLGSLTCLKELDIEGTGISQIPQSILLLKDVHIIGPRGLIQLFGFTSEIQTPECQTTYVRIHDNGMILKISERPGKPIDQQLL